MSWQDRLRGDCTITTPKGTVYRPLWVGDKISGGKRIGVIEYPGIDGATTQDHGLKPFDWPLTLYFEGENNDTESFDFILHYAEKGLWTVVHPVYGTRQLQPVDFELSAMPVESGNVTVVSTKWIESSAKPITGTVDGATQVQFLIMQTNDAAAGALAGNVLTDTLDQVRSVQNAVTAGLASVASVANLVGSAQLVYSQLTALASGYVVDALSIAAAAQALIHTPGLISGDISTRFQAWGKLLTAVLVWDTSGSQSATRNSVGVAETLGVAVVEAAAQEVTTYPFLIRQDALTAMTALATLFDQLTATLDSAQTAFLSARIDAQYFSQSDSYSVLAQLVTMAQRYLLDRVLNLKASRTQTTDRRRATMEVAITEYGANGWDDTMYDFFCASNGFIGDRILILPAGTRYSIYG